MIMAAAHSSKPHIAERLQELRQVWLGYSRSAQEREAKEAALLQEVERVDRAAARISIETERLRRLKDEAMEAVRRVEPGLVDSPSHSRPSSGQSVTQDDMLYLNKDLKHVRDMILSENLHDNDDSGPRLTEMMGSGSHIRRHGSHGSLVPSSPMSRTMPPPMPLMNNWGMYQGPGGYYPPPPHDGGYPPYDENYGYYPYVLAPPPPPHHQPRMSQSQMWRMYEQGHPRGHPRFDRDMSSEGENTSNDACDLSSSEASGSGRRRKNKSFSPKPPLMTRPERRKSASRSRKSRPQSPRVDIQDSSDPIRLINPDVKKTGDQKSDTKKLSDCKEPEINDDETVKESDPTKVKTPPSDSEEERKEVDETLHPKPAPIRNNSKSEQLKRMESEQKFVLESGDEDEDKLYSSETESSVQEPEAQEKKTSLDRERKVGLVPRQNSVVETTAYQQMLQGGGKKSSPVVIDDETSSDDIEAQLAVPKPRTNFMSGSGGLHNEEDQSFGDSSPVQTKQQTHNDLIVEAEPLRMTGMGGQRGFGLPGIAGAASTASGLAGGKLGHPLAQRAGMMALSTGAHAQTGGEDPAHLSAPDDDDDDDFWG